MREAAMILEIGVFETTTIAMCVFFLGYAIVMRSSLLKKYSIPEAVVGGSICALGILVVFVLADVKIIFDLERRDIFLVYFFAALGLRTNVREIFVNGRPLFILTVLAAVFIVVQNLVGMGLAGAFDHPSQTGIVTGSVALVGRSGTTIAWAPFFQSEFGLEQASQLGLAINMVGLIAACAVGSPLARYLIQRQGLKTADTAADADAGFFRDAPGPRINHQDFLLALLRIHVAILFGHGLMMGLEEIGSRLPLYVTCLIAGILLGRVRPPLAPNLDWSASDTCLTIIAYVSLGLFYTMTFMNLQLWTAQGNFGFILAVILVQAIVAVGYVWLFVFPLMGRDYDAAVMSGGFVGTVLGSTATAMAIMSAVSAQYGRAHRAFIIMPLACSVFIDIINSVIIALFTRL